MMYADVDVNMGREVSQMWTKVQKVNRGGRLKITTFLWTSFMDNP